MLNKYQLVSVLSENQLMRTQENNLENKNHPKLKSGILSLLPIEGELGYEQTKHLLNRCVFGARHSEIEFLKNKTAEEALDFLLTGPIAPPTPPLSVKESDEEAPIGQTWTTIKYNSDYRSERLYSYLAWWMGQIVHRDLNLTEKMAFFWHNHFVTEHDVVRNTNFNYTYNTLLREQALGNIKTFAEKITVSPAMLDYLDGFKNVNGAPNENYARELFELFTIGKGPLIGEGNYTFYTEHDIREAAKVLTGWKINANEEAYFNSSKHDKSKKIFSEYYNHKSISNNEEEEYKDLITLIFEKKDTARYLVRKLYRYLVYYQIEEEIEEAIIEPLSTILFENKYELKPVLRTLLSSQHFFDTNLRGCMIKNPLEVSAGILRQLEFEIPENTDPVIKYSLWNSIRYAIREQDLEIGNPPDVAGWPAWYLEPLFDEIWINTATVPERASFIQTIIFQGFKTKEMPEKMYFDPFKIAYLAEDPSDINTLISTVTGLLFPHSATESQIQIFKDILIQGLPDFEWTIEWTHYINNPEDENQKKLISDRLKLFIAKVTLMAEYQLM